MSTPRRIDFDSLSVAAGFSLPAVERHFVHCLPVATTIVAALFTSVLYRHWRRKPGARYLLWWMIGVALYGVGTRVMLARILAQASPIALLDEPTASLDAGNGEKALRTLSHNPESNATVICVLHDLNQAAFHCDRLLLLDGGRLVRAGSPEDVLDGDLLSELYGQTMRVVDHPFRNCPLVLVA